MIDCPSTQQADRFPGLCVSECPPRIFLKSPEKTDGMRKIHIRNTGELRRVFFHRRILSPAYEILHRLPPGGIFPSAPVGPHVFPVRWWSNVGGTVKRWWNGQTLERSNIGTVKRWNGHTLAERGTF